MTAPAINTPYRICAMALQDAGKIQQIDVPEGELLANTMNRLQDTINYWCTQGLKLWTQADISIPLTVGVSVYDLGPGLDVDMTKPLRALQGYYLDQFGIRRPVTCLSANEWFLLSTTTQQGPITQYFVEKLVTKLRVRFWLTPDTETALGTAHLWLQQQITNPIMLTEALDFPQETFLALRWLLADDLCTGQPQAIMDRCKARADSYRMALEAWDVEDADVKIQPDQRMFEPSGFS